MQVEALLAAVTSGGDVVVQLHVLIDLATLQDGLHANSVCELADGTALPVSVVRQMACEAEIIPIVLGGDGRALDIGRAARLATEAQRQALRAMHRTCIQPDCQVPFDECRIHHIVPWEHGGRTDLSNLAPLCESCKHHHDVHEGGWTLTMTPDRVATWTRPDGTIYWTGPPSTAHPTASHHHPQPPNTNASHHTIRTWMATSGAGAHLHATGARPRARLGYPATRLSGHASSAAAAACPACLLPSGRCASAVGEEARCEGVAGAGCVDDVVDVCADTSTSWPAWLVDDDRDAAALDDRQRRRNRAVDVECRCLVGVGEHDIRPE